MPSTVALRSKSRHFGPRPLVKQECCRNRFYITSIGVELALPVGRLSYREKKDWFFFNVAKVPDRYYQELIGYLDSFGGGRPCMHDCFRSVRDSLLLYEEQFVFHLYPRYFDARRRRDDCR